MTLFLLRDDDANATTDPERLARTFAPLLDAGLPINFSVIPEVALDTRAPDGQRERFLSEAWPDEDRCVTLTAAAPVARWLADHPAQAEALVHGLSHRRVRGGTEFGALTYEEARVRIARGKSLLRDAIGEAPTGFVAPWDALSQGSLQAAVGECSLVSTSWLGRGRLRLRWWPAHVRERLTKSEAVALGGAWVLRHRGGLIGPDVAAQDVGAVLARLAAGARVCVVVLHHWMFWERPEPHPVVRALAAALRGRTVLRARDCVEALRS
jgi:hypothetical protein